MRKGSVVHISVTARRVGAAAGALAAVAGGAAIAVGAPARPAAATGGLSITPARIEQTAAAGAGGTITVANRSAEALAVTVSARPWRQSSAGAVSPNRRATLSAVRLSETSFTLAAGADRKIAVSLAAVPSAGSLYGALEVIGLPRDAATRKGVVTGYRLIGSLRLDPATRLRNLRPGAVKVVRSGSRRAIALRVRNAGNTIERVSGGVRLRGPLGTRNAGIRAVRILPGHTVAMPLVSARGLPAGRYTARISLRQGGQRTNVTKRIRVRR